MDHGASRGYNYPEPHVGATRHAPHAPANDGVGGWRIADGPLASMPYARDATFVEIGRGAGDYARAKGMMRRWGHFQLGWSEVAPDTGVKEGDLVCVCANVAGVWIRNPLRVVYAEEAGATGRRGGGAGGKNDGFSFAHGCLGGHLLSGEESFILERRSDDSVWYGVRTFSRPAHPLALASYPIVRALQRRFARDSTRAMAEGMAEGGVRSA
ncbi:predicted protein [Micromonas commoda]|uniref:DUF1990 domain-containing protein n=1 Tax=Micromonas commoda (strain RCC299 / NOUM17 / CCMP2709) TaxID=296587 RepID=C1EGW3_MICCC|nr:predicted protein [Micromonas commoda]ACO67194.1 predicted protein [Micromonas commoda]|eukprot:XP_002505936.1 predicted protein [Micromonas commoda]